METFIIHIKRGYKTLSFKVNRVNVTPRTEDFEIIAPNKTVLIQSNRPFFRNKRLMHRKPDFKLLSNNLDYANGLDELAQAIMIALESPVEKPDETPIESTNPRPSSPPLRDRKAYQPKPTLAERIQMSKDK